MISQKLLKRQDSESYIFVVFIAQGMEKFRSQRWSYVVSGHGWIFVNMLGIASRTSFESQPVEKYDTLPSLAQITCQVWFMAFCSYVFMWRAVNGFWKEERVAICCEENKILIDLLFWIFGLDCFFSLFPPKNYSPGVER